MTGCTWMERKVIDASVVVKWYIQERHSDKAENIRIDFVQKVIDLLCPNLLPFEVLNALKYSNLFEVNDLEMAGESLGNYPFTYMPLSAERRSKMIELSVEHDLSMYDAAYVALALDQGIPFITADEKIKRKLPENVKEHVFTLVEL